MNPIQPFHQAPLYQILGNPNSPIERLSLYLNQSVPAGQTSDTSAFKLWAEVLKTESERMNAPFETVLANVNECYLSEEEKRAVEWADHHLEEKILGKRQRDNRDGHPKKKLRTTSFFSSEDR